VPSHFAADAAAGITRRAVKTASERRTMRAT
jgi:hypothetical protein